MKQFTVQDFFKRFPDDAACLEHLMRIRHGRTLLCPSCARHGNFTRIAKRPVYQCSCGFQISPMKDTPFEKSRTSLQKWFYAMYLFTTSRNGVSAKELQRQLGVTYKCAWRMGHEIRKYMAQVNGNTPLSGHVEVDETFIGGRGTHKTKTSGKVTVLGMLQRDGNIVTKVVPNMKKETVLPLIHQIVERGSLVSTDQGPSYRELYRENYQHEAVNHSAGQYVKGVHHVNNLEGFWGVVKRSIRGTYIHVSSKHAPKYLAEFEYRYNMRKCADGMYGRLLLSF